MTDSRPSKAATVPAGDLRNEEPVGQQFPAPVIPLPNVTASSTPTAQAHPRITPTENPTPPITRPLRPGVLESASRPVGWGLTNPLPPDLQPVAPDLLASGSRPFGPVPPPNGTQPWQQPF